MLPTEDGWHREVDAAGATGRELLAGRGRRVPVGWWWLAGGIAVGSLAVGAALVLRDHADGPAAAPTPATAPAITTVTTVAPTDPTAAAPPPSAPAASTAPVIPTTGAPAPVATGPRYVGLVHGLADIGLPAEVTWYGGALLTDDVATAWVGTPDGGMFWLERAASIDEAAQVLSWEVVDSVVFPPLEQDVSDVVFLGSEECLVGDRPEALLGIFPYQGTEWLTEPHAAWVVDLRSLRFVAVTDGVTCRDPGFGA
jgi:hypothetical protein